MTTWRALAGVVLLVLATVTTPLLVVTPAAAADQPDAPEIVSNSGQPTFIVHYHSSATVVEDWAAQADDRRITAYRPGSNEVVVAAPRYEIAGVDLTDFDALVSGTASVTALWRDSLADNAGVAWVAPNYNISVDPVENLVSESEFSEPTIGRLSINDPAYETGGLAFSKDAQETWITDAANYTGTDEVAATGDNITVAVVDTGATYDNGATFDGQLLNASKNIISNKTVEEDGWAAIKDGNGHGDWTASAVHQVAPNASLLVLKALDDEGSGSTADITAAIRYATDHDADVISLSLGSPQYTQALAAAVKYATDNGTVVVAAAGNSRQTWRWVATPGDVDGVITVSATNATSVENAGVAYFANIGPSPGTTDGSNGASEGETPDVAAPGMKITVPTANGNSTLTGTSMSTPIVAGGIALALDAHPEWRGEPGTVAEWARRSARPIPGASHHEVGAGMFAVDTMVDEWDLKSQQSTESEEAEARGAFYRALAESEGGWLARLAATQEVAS